MKDFVKHLWMGLTHTNGIFSHTKTFSSVAYIVSSWVVIHQQLNDGVSTEMMLVYLATVAGHNVLLRSPLMKGKGITHEDLPATSADGGSDGRTQGAAGRREARAPAGAELPGADDGAGAKTPEGAA